MLQVSDISQYFYCPRKLYFTNILGLKLKPRRKMGFGKEEHEKEHRRVSERRTVYGFPKKDVKNIFHNMAVEVPEIGLYGVVDAAILLKSGEVVPVDVKYSNFETVNTNWQKQLTAYALLLDSKFNTSVTRAIIYLPKQQKCLNVNISGEEKAILREDIQTIKSLISSETPPDVSKGSQCNYSEIDKFCV